ncbi:MAG: hypothetical protein J1D77_07310 [Muribaculaceae bacterium]|nr:hypothetical protein [Muribaculaceae bacterium]
MHKRIFRNLFLILTLVICVPAVSHGVTKEEMEQARTIATKAYLRYANDGSGYLDDINPKTMAELEAALKTKEKENIKAFKAIPVPTDYKDWGKEKLVEYWATTAFQTKGLLEKGRGGRLRARSQINKMTIAAPKPETPATQPAQTTSATGSKPNTAPADTAKNETGMDQASQISAELNAIDDEAPIEGTDLSEPKAYNYTWVYIMVLAILVAIVVALVVYAANVMKKNGSNHGAQGRRNEEDTEHIEHLESALADKDVEIAMLNKKLESASRQNEELKGKLEKISAELAALKRNPAETTRREPSAAAQSPSPEKKPAIRSIFLGRANNKGIFVRADRTLNIGNSVFTLDTSDGYTGTFRVADSPAAWSLALSNPKEYLENACTGSHLDDPDGASKITTDTAGTAIFEGGCWRVTRKARISYS